jgi:hypothetical protein
MTVSVSDITSGPYSGNDIADTFNYDFKIFESDQIEVYETDDSGTVTLLTLTTDYTLTGVGNDNGGTVVRVAGALPTGYTWYLVGTYPIEQTASFASQGSFSPSFHETAFDKLVYQNLKQQDQIDRSVRFADSYSGNASVEIAAPVAGSYLRWNDAGDALITDDDALAVLAISADVTAVADIAANVTTVATNAANVVLVAAVDSEIAALGPIAADISAVAAIDSDVSAVAANAVDISLVADNIALLQSAPINIGNLLDVDTTGIAAGQVLVYDNGTSTFVPFTIADSQEPLSGATLTAVTVAAADKVLIQDASDSDNLKTVTAQEIADLGGGGTVWLEGADLSANPFYEIDFTSYTEYDTIIAVGVLAPVVDGRSLYVQNTNNIASFTARPADYSGKGQQGATDLDFNSAGITNIPISGNGAVGNAAGEGISFTIVWRNPHSTSFRMGMTWDATLLNGTPTQSYAAGGSVQNSAEDIEGARILFQTGNIASGRIDIYGMVKS